MKGVKLNKKKYNDIKKLILFMWKTGRVREPSDAGMWENDYGR